MCLNCSALKFIHYNQNIIFKRFCQQNFLILFFYSETISFLKCAKVEWNQCAEKSLLVLLDQLCQSNWHVYCDLFLSWENSLFFPLYYWQGIEKSIYYSFPCGGKCSKRAFSRRLKCTMLIARNKTVACGTGPHPDFCVPYISPELTREQRCKLYMGILIQMWIFRFSNTSTMTVKQ